MKPNPNILVLHLSKLHSLDIVRVPSVKKFRVVFAERWAVQRRAFVDLTYEQAAQLAVFLMAPDGPADLDFQIDAALDTGEEAELLFMPPVGDPDDTDDTPPTGTETTQISWPPEPPDKI